MCVHTMCTCLCYYLARDCNARFSRGFDLSLSFFYIRREVGPRIWMGVVSLLKKFNSITVIFEARVKATFYI